MMPRVLSALRDRCPECCALLAVTPSTWRVAGGEVRCEYRCPTCRREWATSWQLAIIGRGAAA
jgi:hypothetical protein